MRYAGLIKNDTAAAPGICVTLFTQGCPHRCHGCHNPETWSFDGGKEFTFDTIEEIINGLKAQGIQRNFCVMGGEPLCEENALLTYTSIWLVKMNLPETKVYVWTGYTLEELKQSNNLYIQECLKIIDVLIDGPYIESERDITLSMRGSRNQRIIDLTKNF